MSDPNNAAAEGSPEPSDTSPFRLLDLPDELIVHIFRLHRQSYEDVAGYSHSRDRHFAKAPSAACIRLNKRIWRLVSSTWTQAVVLALGKMVSMVDRRVGRLLVQREANNAVCFLSLDIDAPLVHSRLALVSHFPNITHLSLTLPARSFEVTLLTEALRRAVHVEHLMLDGGQHLTSAEPFSFDEMPALRQVTLRASPWLQNAFACKPARITHMAINLEGHPDFLIPWTTLKHLTLRSAEGFASASFWRQLDFLHHDNNHTASPIPLLSLSIDIHHPGARHPSAWTQVEELLERLSCTSLHKLKIDSLEDMFWGSVTHPNITRVTLLGQCDFTNDNNNRYDELFRFLDCFPSLVHLTLDSRIGPLWHKDFTDDEDGPRTLARQARHYPHFTALVYYLTAQGILELCVRDTRRKEWIEVRWSRRSAAEEFVQERFTISRA
ncbi:hypothetical protein JCM10450v2_006230 [Rhodotorula kratochvilovae]